MSKKPREPKGRVGGDRAFAVDDPGDPVARHAERVGERIGAEPEGLQELLPEDHAGVDRTDRPEVAVDDVGVVDGRVAGYGHGRSSR